MKVRKEVYLGKEIELVKTEDYAYRNCNQRAVKIYRVYRDAENNPYVRAKNGCNTVIMASEEVRDFGNYIVVKKGTPMWNTINRQQRRTK